MMRGNDEGSEVSIFQIVTQKLHLLGLLCDGRVPKYYIYPHDHPNPKPLSPNNRHHEPFPLSLESTNNTNNILIRHRMS